MKSPAKLLSLVVLLVAVVTGPLQAQLTWETNSTGSITITGGCPSSPGEVVIPDTINGLPVTAIGGGAFAWCTNLTNVIVPDSVTNRCCRKAEGPS